MLWWILHRLDSKDQNTRAAAVDKLSGYKSDKAFTHLLDALKDDSLLVRSAAARALGQAGDMRALDSLIGLLNDDSTSVREAVVHALANIGGEKIEEPLITALKDTSSIVRRVTANVLKRFDSQKVKQALSEYSYIEEDSLKKYLAEKDEKRRLAEEAKKVPCPRCKRRDTAKMENGKYWCSWCNDWAVEDLPEYPEEWIHNEEKMIETLERLCKAYALNDRQEINSLEPIATQIGKALDLYGGIKEMRRIYNQIPIQQGKRTLDMHWNGIGEWRG